MSLLKLRNRHQNQIFQIKVLVKEFKALITLITYAPCISL